MNANKVVSNLGWGVRGDWREDECRCYEVWVEAIWWADQLHSMAVKDEEHSYSTRSPHVHIGHRAQAWGVDRKGLEQRGP